MKNRILPNTKGFTLVEIMIVVVIIGLLLSIVIPAANNAIQAAVITNIRGNLRSQQTAITSYLKLTTSNGLIPITRATTIAGLPLEGTTIGSDANTVSNALTLDRVLLTEHIIEEPFKYGIGISNTTPTGSNIAQWNPITAKFFTAAAAADQTYVATPHMECTLSNTTVPSDANGANFMLDGFNNLPANSRVAYLVIPNCTLSKAAAVANSINGNTAATTTASCNSGIVVYKFTAGSSTTTLYCYITSQ
jgi:prepilin-type N-terminal cleavage/methylation domain-containing protein